MSDLVCPCCYPQAAFFILVGLYVVVYLIMKIVNMFVKNKYIAFVSTWFSRITGVVILLVAISLGSIASNEDLKQFVFYKFAMVVIAKENSAMDPIRCDMFRNISGRVLEIGPGPATNFRCWGNLTSVTEWVGVEPNNYFKEALEAEKVKRNVSFPTRTVWLKGENVDVEPESFDYVVGAHVLCSVDSVPQVLHQVSRALKPGGKYLFMEHVAAEKGSLNDYAQQVFQPFINIIGNGCQFKKLWVDIDEKTSLPGFEVDLKHTIMPIGIPMLAPHVIGTAMKR